jgi:hypothetical protein
LVKTFTSPRKKEGQVSPNAAGMGSKKIPYGGICPLFWHKWGDGGALVGMLKINARQ